MGISLFETNYNNYQEVPYLNRGEDDSSHYINDLTKLSSQVSDDTLSNADIQSALEEYYRKDYHDLDLNQLEEHIANAFVENEKLSKEELKNKLGLAIKTENIHRNLENNEFYNAALQRMVTEDISLDTIEIDKVKQILHNKTRNLEIRKYYNEKMNYQIKIVKTIIIICLILLAITLLYKMNILNTHLYIAFIGVGLASIVIFTIGRLIDILIRDNKNFDEYAYIRSHHYLNKGDGNYKTLDDIPLHQQDDLISDKCLQVMNDNDD